MEPSDFSKVAGYTVNTQKSIAFLYTNNEYVEFEIKNTILLTLIPPKMKHLDTDQNMYNIDPYEETHNILIKKSNK